MQWDNSYFSQDPLDPLLLNDTYAYDNDDANTEIHLFPPIEPSSNNVAISTTSHLNDEYIDTFNNYYYYNDDHHLNAQAPFSIDNTLSVDDTSPHLQPISHGTTIATIDVNNLINSKISPILKSSKPISNPSLSLSSTSTTRFPSIASSPNTEIDNGPDNVHDITSDGYDDDDEDGDNGRHDNDKILNNLHLNPNSKSTKKISDSRLSLAQLAIVLNLQGNEEETGKREKNILNILKNELNFPIGEKTWIRDTPLVERDRIIHNLTELVESRFKYGYNKRILSIIVRRASYYMMQGRLRRERRLKRKRKSTDILELS